MKQITLDTKNRTESGRQVSRKLRREGSFPAVLYGESGVRHLSLDTHAFAMSYRKIAGSAALIELKSEESKESTFAIIQEIQRVAKSDEILHVDFKEVVRGHDMEADIPVQTRGISHGVKNYGGILEISTDELRVRCRPRDLPEAIVIDVTNLEIGKSIHLNEVPAPEGVTFLDDMDQVVVACVGASSGASSAADDDDDEKEVVASEKAEK